MYPELKENRPHGTDNYPYTQYHMHNIFHAFQIPVHWHDELEVIYTKKGPLNLLIDGKEYTAEDGSVLWQNRICFIPAIPKAPAVSRKSCYLIFSKITVFAFLCTISPDISICPKNISPGISGNISSLRSRSISRTCGYPTQSICWKPQVSPSQRQHCRAAFQT